MFPFCHLTPVLPTKKELNTKPNIYTYITLNMLLVLSQLKKTIAEGAEGNAI